MARPPTAAPNQDRRIARTHARLTAALIELLLERGWEGIGVAELCERADVARSTFYLHYANKEELLERGFAELRSTIRTVAPATSLKTSGHLGFVDAVAAHIFENRRVFMALIGSSGSGLVRERFRGLLALVAFLSGGFVALAAHVMLTNRSSAQQFAEQFHALAAGTVG
jgi:AcrR family transcriptional regulator